MAEFTIYPILGRKTNVPADSPAMFKQFGDGIATHDAGGVNFDLQQKKGACSRSNGFDFYTTVATGEATKCLGLFQLNASANTDHIYIDNGKFYYISGTTQTKIEDAGTTTFATDDTDLYSFVRVGDWVLFADYAEHATQAWKNGEANLIPAISGGGSYEFRIIDYWKQRVIGLHSAETNGDIEVRWSNTLPVPGTSLTYAAGDQLYIPNDDPIRGGGELGVNSYCIYCEDSIQQMSYSPDYETPFQLYTVVPGQGCVNHHSIVSLGDRHFMFNKNYGFCEYRGGTTFPHGKPISEDIEDSIRDISADYYNLIVGAYIPLERQIIWTVPANGNSSPNTLFVYDIDTQQWDFRQISARCVSSFKLNDDLTWVGLTNLFSGSTTVWDDIPATAKWADYASTLRKPVFGNTNGHLTYRIGNSVPTYQMNGYRIEPVLNFGDSRKVKTINKIHFSLGIVGDYDMTVHYRTGNTLGELEASGWTATENMSMNSPNDATINTNITGRLIQIKWGTYIDEAPFEVDRIVFDYTVGNIV